MALHPLVLSVQASAWSPEERPGEGIAVAAGACLFCGLPAEGTAALGVPEGRCCPLCYLCLHLECGGVDRDATLIWLPEMAQGALNLLTREIHLALQSARQSPKLDALDADGVPENVRAARIAYRSLAARGEAAEARLGTTRPSDLGAALLRLTKDEYGDRAQMLGGTRLLSLGQLHAGDRDVYPSILAGWMKPADAASR